jgi:rhomboid family GlyGly-CTERM serine protease
VGVGLVVLNLGLFPGFEGNGAKLLTQLQFDGVAIRQGELWRLLTGNLVHWDRPHFWLDVIAFLVLGLLYERHLGWRFPCLLLWTATIVGFAQLLWWPPNTLCRGLSGVDSGLFAAALCFEVTRALKSPRRWLWLAPAAALFVCKLVYEATTGRLFLSALVLTDEGGVANLAHVVGAVSAVGFYLLFPPKLGEARQARQETPPARTLAPPDAHAPSP